MLKKALILVLAGLFCGLLNGAEPPKDTELFNLVEAERNFSKEAAMFGRKKAFVDNLASDCLIFTDKWVSNGRDVFKERKDSPTILKWEPEFAGISESKDFGVTTGPWELQEFRPNTKPLAKGYFLSVWKKQSDGVWKVALDVGSANPIPEDYKIELSFLEAKENKKTQEIKADKETAKKEILKEEKNFQECSKNGVSGCEISFFTEESRLICSGKSIAKSIEEIKKILAETEKSAIFKAEGCDVASSGDLGFVYGTIENKEEIKLQQGCFVRIWKKDNSGKWKILIELIN